VRLDGERVRLRDWRLEDLDVLARWLKPGHRWQEFDAPYYQSITEQSIPAYLERIAARITANNLPDPRTHLVIAGRAQDQLIGQVSCYWISEETCWLAAGIVLYDPALWGQGLGFEALGLWTDHLFRARPQLVRLDLQTWSGNTGMMRLAEKLGYQLEGRFRSARIVAGAYHDALGYGILREEWQAKYPHGFSTGRNEDG
jgi:putative hydrolase of HD superfamily